MNHKIRELEEIVLLKEYAIEELEVKLTLAEGEWKTYFKSSESLAEKLAKSERKLKVVVEALEILRQNLKWDSGNSEIIREALTRHKNIDIKIE